MIELPRISGDTSIGFPLGLSHECVVFITFPPILTSVSHLVTSIHSSNIYC